MLERKTAVSTEVLQVLSDSDKPLSVPQILDCLNKKGLSPNKTTVYRIIEKLLNKHVAKAIRGPRGATYYEVSPSGSSHNHFICNSCDTVFCLESTVETTDLNLSGLVPENQFHIQSHDFNFYGVCDPCSEEK